MKIVYIENITFKNIVNILLLMIEELIIFFTSNKIGDKFIKIYLNGMFNFVLFYYLIARVDNFNFNN